MSDGRLTWGRGTAWKPVVTTPQPISQRAGTPIRPNDLWIAPHALATERVVVTGNVRAFSCVSGLAVEDWRDGR